MDLNVWQIQWFIFSHDKLTSDLYFHLFKPCYLLIGKKRIPSRGLLPECLPFPLPPHLSINRGARMSEFSSQERPLLP